MSTTATDRYDASPLRIDPMTDDSMSRYWFRDIGLFILLIIPINSHPMSLLPSIASSNIADLLSKPLPASTHRRFLLALGDDPTTPLTTSVASTVAATVVAPTTTLASDSVPFHPN